MSDLVTCCIALIARCVQCLSLDYNQLEDTDMAERIKNEGALVLVRYVRMCIASRDVCVQVASAASRRLSELSDVAQGLAAIGRQEVARRG
jgi:hypothetical protein